MAAGALAKAEVETQWRITETHVTRRARCGQEEEEVGRPEEVTQEFGLPTLRARDSAAAWDLEETRRPSTVGYSLLWFVHFSQSLTWARWWWWRGLVWRRSWIFQRDRGIRRWRRFIVR